jgi:hypothetical protein
MNRRLPTRCSASCASVGSACGEVDIPFEAELVLVTVSSVSEHFTRDWMPVSALLRWADTVAAMLADRIGLADLEFENQVRRSSL